MTRPTTDEERAEWARLLNESEAALTTTERIVRYGTCPRGHPQIAVYSWSPGETRMELACPECDITPPETASEVQRYDGPRDAGEAS